MTSSNWSLAGMLLLLVVSGWLYRINKAMKSVPTKARGLSRHWTREDIHTAYKRVEETPIQYVDHLPPRLDRRYLVVGGSGHVGGEIVKQLLQRGQPPRSIRIVDTRPPSRPDAGECGFIQADITSSRSVQEAFSAPWHASVAELPLTVFHTAAAIRPHERHRMLYDRCHRVNVLGTAHVLDGARTAGADLFVFTSSASVAMERVKFWIWPWQSEPVHYAQHYDESDFDGPRRPHESFFGNYGVSKAESERLVCGANRDGFRTGVLRPGNAVYGQMGDQLVGNLLQQSTIITWFPHVVQNFVSGRNVALAHLQFEAALARAEMPRCAGRPFNVTDPNPPLVFGDLYEAVKELSGAPVRVLFAPPVVLLVTAHLVEGWCLLLARVPFLSKLGLREPGPPVLLLQPSVFSAASHAIVDDSAARRRVEDGGLGYEGVCTTIDGFCEQMLDWKRERDAMGKS